MGKKVSELTGSELDHWVAKANGWSDTLGGINGDEPAWLLSDGKSRLLKSAYSPTSDRGQGESAMRAYVYSVFGEEVGNGTA